MGDQGDFSTMQHQVLNYPARKSDSGQDTGGDMHPHLDGPQTHYVAIATVGNDCTFAVDHANVCHRFFHNGLCAATGVKQQGDMQRWKQQSCPTCTELTLRSGDIVLFHGHPSSSCCHGVLATHRSCAAPAFSLPNWCSKARVSFQVRNTTRGWGDQHSELQRRAAQAQREANIFS
jgi:hypothetical protein